MPLERAMGAAVQARGAATNFMSEFRAFALKGNVVDLAVGVVIGGAFGKIVDSLVKHVIMPLVSMLLPGEQGYLGWKIIVGAKEIPYGLFLGEVVNFLIVAMAMFVFVVKFLKFVTRTKNEQAIAAPPPLTLDQTLLTEIRDHLAKRP